MTYFTRPDGLSALHPVRFIVNSDGSRTPVFTLNDDVDSYSGIGALGPYTQMVATSSSPIILASVRYTGSRRVQINQYRFSPFIDMSYPYINDQPLTVGLRKLELYTAEDTGGTNMSPYFGARKRSTSPAVSGFSVRIAGIPGTATSTGLTAGTRTPLNFSLQRTLKIPKSTTGDLADLTGALDDPIELLNGEGFELALIAAASSGDTGRMYLTAQFDWREVDV